MLASGEFATIGDLAVREGIAVSYLTRVLQLTLLAPEIVEAILEGKQGPEVTLSRVLEPFPSEREPRTSDEAMFRQNVTDDCSTLRRRKRRNARAKQSMNDPGAGLTI